MKFQKGHTINLGKHHTKETKEKIRQTLIGNALSEETKQKISDKLRGIKRSEITKEKMRLAQKGKNNWHWMGGKYVSKRGYILVLMPEHPFAKRGYVIEHRLVMEKFLGRYLKPTEVVHHKNGIKTDNRIENLELFENASKHHKYHSKLKRLAMAV
jgi:hypothetical protein